MGSSSSEPRLAAPCVASTASPLSFVSSYKAKYCEGGPAGPQRPPGIRSIADAWSCMISPELRDARMLDPARCARAATKANCDSSLRRRDCYRPASVRTLRAPRSASAIAVPILCVHATCSATTTCWADSIRTAYVVGTSPLAQLVANSLASRHPSRTDTCIANST